jgi:hypothetical protein
MPRCRPSAVALLALLLGLIVCGPDPALAAEKAVVIPAPAVDNRKVAAPMQTAVIAAGCFWGVQGVYQHVRESSECCRAIRAAPRRPRSMRQSVAATPLVPLVRWLNHALGYQPAKSRW